jgi:hypothetical protein
MTGRLYFVRSMILLGEYQIYNVMSLACLLGASLTYAESHMPGLMQAAT